MNRGETLGEQVTYEGLVVAILNEEDGGHRIEILDGRERVSSICAGHTRAGVRERALELAYAYLLKRDGAAPKPAATLLWRPICV